MLGRVTPTHAYLQGFTPKLLGRGMSAANNFSDHLFAEFLIFPIGTLSDHCTNDAAEG